jgi:hypothetical protein
MDAISNQVQWPDTFIYYLLFDLAMFGVLILGYFSLKIIVMSMSKYSKNQSKYH